MRISVFYDHVREASQQTGIPIQEILRRVRRFGISVLECSLESLSEKPDEIRAMFDECDMKVSCIYAMYDFANSSEASLAYPLIDAAVSFGADKVLIVPGFVNIEENGEMAAVKTRGTAKMYQIAEVLRDVLKYAQSKNITLTMEDFDDAHAPFSSDEQLLWFLNEVPGLRISFDTGNFMYAAVDEIDAFEKLSGYISHVHCKDRSLSGFEDEEPKVTVDGKNMYAAPVGCGCIHMEEIVKRLMDMGYDDTLAIEHFGAADQLGFMEQSAKWLLKQLEEK